MDQEVAVSAMLHHDDGVLCAPTAFGKTVVAAAIIARRRVNTLVLVHRTELLKQWQERLQAFLAVDKKACRHYWRRQVETHRKHRHRRNAVAVSPGGSECTGRELWAGNCRRMPPRRRRLLRCHPEADKGEVRTWADRDANPPRWAAADHLHAVWPDSAHGGQARRRSARPGSGAPIALREIDLPPEAGIQDVFRHLATDHERTRAIAAEVRRCVCARSQSPGADRAHRAS